MSIGCENEDYHNENSKVIFYIETLNKNRRAVYERNVKIARLEGNHAYEIENNPYNKTVIRKTLKGAISYLRRYLND